MERFRALWNQAMQRPWIAKCWQFVKFGIVGVSNTLISLAVYQLALNALGMHYLAANLLGLVISVINAYYWNNLYRKRGDTARYRLDIPDAWALEIIPYAELSMLKSISKEG